MNLKKEINKRIISYFEGDYGEVDPYQLPKLYKVLKEDESELGTLLVEALECFIKRGKFYFNRDLGSLKFELKNRYYIPKFVHIQILSNGQIEKMVSVDIDDLEEFIDGLETL